MKFNRRFWLLALLPLAALGWAMKSAASWRPQTFGVQPNAASSIFSSDGQLLLVDTINNVNGFHVWDVATARPLWKKGSRYKCLLISPNSRWMVVAHTQSPLPNRLWDLQGVALEVRDARTGRLIRTLDAAPNESSTICVYGFSPDNSEFRLATTASLKRWNMADGRLISVHKWPVAKGPLSSADFIPGKNQLVAFDGSITLLDARTGKVVRRFPPIPYNLSPYCGNSLQVTPDGFSFYTTSCDTGQISRVYRLSDGKELWRNESSLTFSYNGKLAYIRSDASLDVLDAHTGRKLNQLPEPPYGFAPSPDGNWLFAARKGKIYKWRAR